MQSEDQPQVLVKQLSHLPGRFNSASFVYFRLLSFIFFVFTSLICPLCFSSRSWLPHGLYYFFLAMPRFYFHLLIYTAVTQIPAFAFQGSCVISKAMGDPVNYVHFKKKPRNPLHCIYWQGWQIVCHISLQIDKANSGIISLTQKGPFN